MKTTVKKIAEAYAVLGKLKMNTADEQETMKALKMRKAMRRIAEDYESFLKDAQDKFKPEGFDDKVSKAQASWKEMSEEERMSVNRMVHDYNKKVESSVSQEAEKEIDMEIEAFSEETIVKVMRENNMTFSEISPIDF